MSARETGTDNQRYKPKLVPGTISSMIKTEFLDNLVRQVMQALPGGDGRLTGDLEKNLRAAIQGVFSRMDLVTREEFELQSELLVRSRTKLEQLEQRLAELETQLKDST